jgi:hypothetical protein
MHDGQVGGARRAEGSAIVMKRVVAVLLGLLGMAALGIGLYFLLLRPAMLPEDLRFTGVRPGEVPARLLDWLTIVFRTWGGFMVGFGVVLIGVATSFLRATRTLLRVGTAVGIIAAFGQFFLSNLAISSDYLVVVGLLFGLALAAGVGLILGLAKRPRL